MTKKEEINEVVSTEPSQEGGLLLNDEAKGIITLEDQEDSEEEGKKEPSKEEILMKVCEGLKDEKTGNNTFAVNRTLIMQVTAANISIPKDIKDKLRKIETEFTDEKGEKASTQEENSFYSRLIKGICGCDGTTLKIIIALSQCLDHTNKLLENKTTIGVSSLIREKPFAVGEIVQREVLQKGVFCYPVIKLTLRDLAKMVYCRNKIGNNDLSTILGKLRRLEKVPCSFAYKEGNDAKIKVQKLISIEYDITLKEVKQNTTVQNYELTIELHPLFGLFKNDAVFLRADFLSKAGNISELCCKLLALIMEQMTYRNNDRPNIYKITLANLKKKIADEERYKKDPQRFIKDLYKGVDTLENIGLIKAEKDDKDEVVKSKTPENREGFKLAKQANGERLCTFYFNEYYTRAAK